MHHRSLPTRKSKNPNIGRILNISEKLGRDRVRFGNSSDINRRRYDGDDDAATTDLTDIFSVHYLRWHYYVWWYY